MKKFSFLIPVFVISFFSVSYFPEGIETVYSSPKDSTVVITISAIGDIMCHSVQYQYARVDGDSFDFTPVYQEVKQFLSEADFTLGNLETVTAGNAKPYSGYPFFNTPDDFIPALKDAGIDLITTSNNHSLDQGERGLRRTIEQLKKNELNYNGTFISESDRDSIRIFDLKGIKVAFLAYTYGTNGVPVPKGKSYLINLIDKRLIEEDIVSARLNGAEVVVVHFHFGEEYKREPVESQITAVNNTVLAGADIIIGGHPHVIQPAKYFKTNNAKLDSGFIAYSLGNFISNQRWRYSDAGVILNIELTKNFTADSIFISDVNFIPTWVFKGAIENSREYIIVPAELSTPKEYLNKADISLMNQSFEDTKEIMTKYSSKVKLKSLKNNLTE